MSKDVRMQVQCEGYGCKIYGEGVRSDLLKVGWVCLEGAWHCPSCSGEMCSDAAPYPPPETEWTSTPPTVTAKPQFFWFRLGPGAKQIPVEVFEIDGEMFCNTFGQIKKLSTSRDGGEWWPVPIEPPRREP